MKQCESYMGEPAGLRSARREIFSLRNSEIGAGWGYSEWDLHSEGE